MRIALTHPYCWPQVRRGSERLLHDLSHDLTARGHTVTVVSSTPGAAREEWDGPVRRVLFAQRQPLRVRNRWCNNLHLFGWQVHRLLMRERFDAVHCLNFLDAYGALLARRRGQPMRITYQMTGIPLRRLSPTMPLDSWLLARVVREADEVLTVSSFAQQAMITHLGRASLLLPSPTDTTPYLATCKPPPDGRLRLLFAADLTEPRKGARLLAQAFVRVLAVRPDATLAYSGHVTTPVRDAVLAGIPPAAAAAISFLDVGDVADLPALYAQASVFVLPSAWEAQGMVFVEALASGTPVVACDHGGVTDIVNDPRIGRRFDPGPMRRRMSSNEAGLAEAILHAAELAARPETAALCRAHAARFSWDRLGSAYEAALLGAPGRACGAVGT